MVATSGARLISEDAIETLKQELFPLATVLTPNIPEAEVLSGQSIKTAEDMISAAKVISDSYHCAVLFKGGQISMTPTICFIMRVWHAGSAANVSTIRTPMVPAVPFPPQLRPTWPRAMTSPEAVEQAKEYISGALAAMLDLGSRMRPHESRLCHSTTLHK